MWKVMAAAAAAAVIAVLLVGLFLTGAELEYASKLRGVFRSVRTRSAARATSMQR